MNKQNIGITEIITNDICMTTDKHTYLCVIMPAYNEEANIEQNLLYTSSVISSFINNYQIIAINDGSSDNTLDAIMRASNSDSHISYISYHHNRGKGFAIKTGVRYANAEYIAFLDSDMELDPSMLRYFLRFLHASDADIAIGSKMHKKSKLNYPLSRKIISFGYYLLLKTIFKLNIKDTQTGIKLFKADIIQSICKDITTDGFAFDIEILATASKMGCKIIEMPITLKYSRTKDAPSKVSLKQIVSVFKDTINIKKQLNKKQF